MKDALVSVIALLGGLLVLYATWLVGGWTALAGIAGVTLLLYSWRLSLTKDGGNKNEDG